MIYLCLYASPDDTAPCDGEIDLADEVEANCPAEAAEDFAINEILASSSYEDTSVDFIWVSEHGSDTWEKYRVETDLVAKAVAV